MYLFYIAHYPVLWTAQRALHFTPQFRHQFGFSGKQSSHAAINARVLFTRISTAVNSHMLIYTPEVTGACGENENPQASKQHKWDSNPGSLESYSSILPLGRRGPVNKRLERQIFITLGVVVLEKAFDLAPRNMVMANFRWEFQKRIL